MAYSYWSSASSSVPLRGPSMEKATLLSLSSSSICTQNNSTLEFSNFTVKLIRPNFITRNEPARISCFSDSTTSTASSPSAEAVETAAAEVKATENALRVKRKRTRYRKQCPGEKTGITEEMRFVAMRLRNVNGKKFVSDGSSDEEEDCGDQDGDRSIESVDKNGGVGGRGETWQPSMEGFVKYLVDSKLVFDTVERIIDDSKDVSYAYFRKTGLERSSGLSKDLEWFSQQDIVIPPPSNPGVTYAKYLEELAEKSAPLFLCHYYNIYFSHIAGGQVIAKQVSDKLLEGRKLQFYRWDGNEEVLLKGVREKLNMLGEHWSRDEKTKCLREATKSFKYLGEVVRLIIL